MNSNAALLGATVKTVCGFLGEPQSHLAKVIGISLSSLNRKLVGKIDWRYGELVGISDHWGIHVWDLLQGPDHAVLKLMGAPVQRTRQDAA